MNPATYPDVCHPNHALCRTSLNELKVTILAMVETQEAVMNLHGILQTPGLDGVFVG
jgi:2-keto-3-deoxy-L-rhamnonate aldolase RhmA